MALQLKHEPELIPSKLIAIDGNNSAKRVVNAGTEDPRRFDSDYFLSPFDVDQFKNEVKRRMIPEQPKPSVGVFLYLKFVQTQRIQTVVADTDGHSDEEAPDAPWCPDPSNPGSMTDAPGDVTDGQINTTPCAVRWKNTAAEHEKIALKVYDQTGIFPSCCRHHIIGYIVEMVRSGEL